MPIYLTDGETNTPINYTDKLRHFADRQIVVHLGKGDVLMSELKSRYSNFDEIGFFEAVPHRIGETTNEHFNEDCRPPVVLMFDKIASIDALIERLERLKDGIMENPTWVEVSAKLYGEIWMQYGEGGQLTTGATISEPNRLMVTEWCFEQMPFIKTIAKYTHAEKKPDVAYFIEERLHKSLQIAQEKGCPFLHEGCTDCKNCIECGKMWATENYTEVAK